MKHAPHPQLRPTVYLYRGLDDALITGLEKTPRRRRAARLLELLHQGLNGEALERAHGPEPVYGAVASESPTRAKMAVALRINRAAHGELYAIIEQAQNQTDRLRTLAAKGLRREARLCQGAGSHPAADTPSGDVPVSLARQLMASMVATLQQRDAP